jgi:undecaprenyl diphosphate synthase
MPRRTTSSTQAIPEVGAVPVHIAIIMDGNGRWAKKRFMPRVAGHKRGLETVRSMVKACIERGVDYLTLFAFSSENWRRPVEESVCRCLAKRNWQVARKPGATQSGG